MTACIPPIAMFGSELWWKGDHTPTPPAKHVYYSSWLTEKRERRQAASGQPTLAPWRWSQDSEQRQRSWKTDSGGSGFGFSAYRREIRSGS